MVTVRSPSNTFADDTLFPHGHPNAVNYYVAGYVRVTSPDMMSTYELGNQAETPGNGFVYQNMPLGDGANVFVFIRVYSGANQPVSGERRCGSRYFVFVYEEMS